MRTATALLVLAVWSITACAPPDGRVGSIERLSPAIDTLIPADAGLEVLADGYVWTEGPVWVDGALLFSDTNTNTIYRWREGGETLAWLNPSGYTARFPRGGGMGSNGLAVDADGRLLLCQHGDRRLAVMDAPIADPLARYVTLADRFRGRRLNSPNDLAIAADGAVWFTDPPYGLASPDSAELGFSGVYRWSATDGIQLLDSTLTRPNGIAFSPDGTTLYVANSDPARALWMAYDVLPEGGVANGRVFFDATGLVGPDRPGLPDGLKLDRDGNLYATGPGGVLVLSPGGEHLGTIRTPAAAANVAFGEDGGSLFVTATGTLLRIRLATTGAGFGP